MLFGSLALAASATSGTSASNRWADQQQWPPKYVLLLDVCTVLDLPHVRMPQPPASQFLTVVLLEDKANDTYYIPGVYPGNINLDSRDRIAVNPALTSTTISTSPMPAAFKAVAFAGKPLSTTEKTFDEAWMSLLLPHGWYGRYSSGEVLWGAVPDRTQLSLSTSLEETMQINSGRMDMCDQLMQALCTPSCSVHGTCVPNQANTNGTCSCDAGWEGDACERCASGHYGSSCMGRCDSLNSAEFSVF